MFDISKAINRIFLFTVLAFILWQFWVIYKLNDTNRRLENEKITLNTQLQSAITIEGNKVKIVYRDKERIKVKIIYIRDGKTVINTDINNDISVQEDWAGFTMKPFIGLQYFTMLSPAIGMKLAYINNFGVNLGIGETAFISASYDIHYGFIQNSSIHIGFPLSFIFSTYL